MSSAKKFKGADGAHHTVPVVDTSSHFNEGDVQIILTDKVAFELDSNILKKASETLADLLDSDSVPLMMKTKRGRETRYMLVLTKNPHPGGMADNGTKMAFVLESILLDGKGQPIDGYPHVLHSSDTAPQVVEAFEDVLRCLGGEQRNIRVGNAQEDSLTDICVKALAITSVAEYLECETSAFTPFIDSTLQATGHELHKVISENPVLWLKYGNQIRSKVIFKEALIHAAGQYNMMKVKQAVADGELPADVVEILTAKANDITEAVKMVERYLISYYPKEIMRKKPAPSQGRESISRANYSNDIFIWMIIAILRHWCGEQMIAKRAAGASDLGYEFIKALGLGGEAYLTQRELLEGFFERFPMSAKAIACVKHRLDEIKDVIKLWAAPLLKNNSQLDVIKENIQYFTHTEVKETDYPWLIEGNYKNEMMQHHEVWNGINGDNLTPEVEDLEDMWELDVKQDVMDNLRGLRRRPEHAYLYSKDYRGREIEDEAEFWEERGIEYEDRDLYDPEDPPPAISEEEVT